MRRSERGATLTELLAVAAMLTLVLVALVPLLAIGRDTWNRVDRHGEVTQNARRALDKLVREVRAAVSFQVVSDSLIRLTKAEGDGSGSTPTVEYRLNEATNELEYRQSGGYFFRRRITVTAGTAVPAGYPVSIVFDHAALVTAGKSLSSGNDVRIIYWTGSRWQELDRFNFNFTASPTAWNTTAVRLWFRLQAPISAGASDNNYYLDYGDLSAGSPPANADYVFLDYEDGTTLTGWTRRDALAGTWEATANDGFKFTSASGSGHRALSKPLPGHSNVELFWTFWNPASGPAVDGRQAGVGARRSNSGTGYWCNAFDSNNTLFRIRYWTNTWSTTGGPSPRSRERSMSALPTTAGSTSSGRRSSVRSGGQIRRNRAHGTWKSRTPRPPPGTTGTSRAATHRPSMSATGMSSSGPALPTSLRRVSRQRKPHRHLPPGSPWPARSAR